MRLTDAEAADLVGQYLPLARGTARRFARGFPFLMADLTSEAVGALWHAARTFAPPPGAGLAAFPNWARRQRKWAMLRRLALERRKHPETFRQQPDPDRPDPAGALADPGPPPDAALEAADLAGRLLSVLPPGANWSSVSSGAASGSRTWRPSGA